MEDKKLTDTLVKKSVNVTVAEQDYTIATFKFAKTVRVFQLLSELAASAGIESVVSAADQSAANGEFEQENGIASSFVANILRIIPKALRDGVPALYKLLGLIITTNQDLKAMERDDSVDTDKVLYEKGMDLAYDGDVEELMNLIVSAVNVMGIESILKNLGPLMGMLRK